MCWRRGLDSLGVQGLQPLTRLDHASGHPDSDLRASGAAARSASRFNYCRRRLAAGFAFRRVHLFA